MRYSVTRVKYLDKAKKCLTAILCRDHRPIAGIRWEERDKVRPALAFLGQEAHDLWQQYIKDLPPVETPTDGFQKLTQPYLLALLIGIAEDKMDCRATMANFTMFHLKGEYAFLFHTARNKFSQETKAGLIVMYGDKLDYILNEQPDVPVQAEIALATAEAASSLGGFSIAEFIANPSTT